MSRQLESDTSVKYRYGPGHSDAELDRLSRQGTLLETFTHSLFTQAGLAPGMRVLDVGCGCGDVSFLSAKIVGPRGKVLGVDRAPAAINRANELATAFGLTNVDFAVDDPVEMKFEKPFDAVVGRLVLMYSPDPAEMVRSLAHNVRRGGLIIFQEFDTANCCSWPPVPTFERCIRWINQVFDRTGVRTRQGSELFTVFQRASLPQPTMRLDKFIGGGPGYFVYEWIASVVRTLLPAIERLGVATTEEIEIESLATRMEDEVTASGGVVTSPSVIGAWSQKSDETA